jgi:hypothetical protein
LELPRIIDSNGFAQWGADLWVVGNSSTTWFVANNGGDDYYTTGGTNEISPVGISFGAPVMGEGVPIVAPDAPLATHLGQWCQASTAWWQWDGTAWIPRFLLNGKQITRDDADTAYFTLGVDTIGLPTTTPFP